MSTESRHPRLLAGRVEDANDSHQPSVYGSIMEGERAPLLSSIQEIEVERVEPARGKTSFGLSVFNLMNAILGSGILGLPYAMAQSGIVLFSLLLLFVASAANFSIHLLLKMCDITGQKAYEDIGLYALGIPGKLMTAVSILFQNTGSMSSYLFIVKNELPAVIRTLIHGEHDECAWYLNGDYLVLLLMVLVIVPLACLPKIGFLGYTSAFSILCMVFFTAVIVAKKFSFPCPIPSGHNHTLTSVMSPGSECSDLRKEHTAMGIYQNSSDQCTPEFFKVTLQTAYAIPTMAFSFVCHTAVLPIYAELSRPSKGRMQNVATTSIGICYTLYMTASLFGYLTFYGETDSEVLHGYSRYDQDNLLILIVRIAVLVAIVLTVPLIHYPVRISLMMIVGIVFPSCSGFSWKLYFLSTFILLAVVTNLAIFVPNIMQIFGIIGATASTSLVFFLPSLFFLKLNQHPTWSKQKILALCLLVMSVCFLIFSLTTIIYGMVHKAS